jgi:hypothetical protein
VLALKKEFVEQQPITKIRLDETNSLLTVGTYNVHMWMDPYDNEGVSVSLRE